MAKHRRQHKCKNCAVMVVPEESSGQINGRKEDGILYLLRLCSCLWTLGGTAKYLRHFIMDQVIAKWRDSGKVRTEKGFWTSGSVC